jgi:hypothetical protein
VVRHRTRSVLRVMTMLEWRIRVLIRRPSAVQGAFSQAKLFVDPKTGRASRARQSTRDTRLTKEPFSVAITPRVIQHPLLPIPARNRRESWSIPEPLRSSWMEKMKKWVY